MCILYPQRPVAVCSETVSDPGGIHVIHSGYPLLAPLGDRSGKGFKPPPYLKQQLRLYNAQKDQYKHQPSRFDIEILFIQQFKLEENKIIDKNKNKDHRNKGGALIAHDSRHHADGNIYHSLQTASCFPLFLLSPISQKKGSGHHSRGPQKA